MRKKIYYSMMCLFLLGILPTLGASINVIPYPEKVVLGEGSFCVSPGTKVMLDKKLKVAGPYYMGLLDEMFGFSLTKKKASRNVVVLRVDNNLDMPEEGYLLNVTAEKVEIISPSEKGVFYGIQTLSQLVIKDGEVVQLPIVRIEDIPRFSWRGCMLDVSRTFMSKELVKRYIDLMASYKLNVLHLHLTDDQGWRVEIKRYPRLTSVGSKFDLKYNDMGGYYTQEDIKEMVRYAALRNVTIVPEIDLPGHTCAAIASYPELSCRGIRPVIHPFFEGPGIHEEIFCAGKENTYEFIFNVLDELMELFPSSYIHIGGDEAPKKEWRACPHCQQAIQANSLSNEEELQSYFVKRLGDYLSQKGRHLVGWDEIIDGGKLKGDEIVMYWRGWKSKEVAEVAKSGFKVVSSPTSHCYFDYKYKTINTEKVYGYDPVPQGTTEEVAGNYIGVQANFWSHIDRSESRIDQQLFPRLLALSEVAWSNPRNKSWKRFKAAAKVHREKLLANQVNCYYDESVYEQR